MESKDVLLNIGISSISGYMSGRYASKQNINTTLSASYIIYIDGTTIKAVNGTTGVVDFSGSDAATVINNAIGNLSSGGNVFIFAGTYNITSSISPGYPNSSRRNNIWLYGAGDATILILSPGASINLNLVDNIKISNLYIDCSNHTTINSDYGIVTVDANNINIDKVTVYNAYGFGICITASTTAKNITVQNCILNGTGNQDVIGGGCNVPSAILSDIIYKNNFVTQSTSIGHTYNVAIDNVKTYRTQIINNSVYGGIVLGNENFPNTYTEIIGNLVKPALNQTPGFISVWTSSNATTNAKYISIRDNIIQGGHIEILGIPSQYTLFSEINNNIIDASFDTLAINVQYGNLINIIGNLITSGGIEVPNSSDISIRNNQISNSTNGINLYSSPTIYATENTFKNVTNPFVGLGGSNVTIKNNIGYVTENSGSSTGTGAQQTVAHGLAITPTRQQIALTAGSATALPFHSAAPDATNIYVTAALNQAWYWATVGT